MVPIAQNITLWRALRTLQFVIFATSLDASVPFTQFFLSLSGFYIQEYTTLAPKDAGILSGALLGSFFLARGFTASIWLRLTKRYGFRQVILTSQVGEMVGTVAIGLCENVWIAVGIRTLAGVFSPIGVLTQRAFQALTVSAMEEVPTLAQNFTIVATIAQALTAIIGGCLAYPAESNLVHNESYFSSKPFFLPLLLIAILQFFAILCFYIDFPDLVYSTEKPKGKAKKPERAGAYAELSESNGHLEMQRSDCAIVVPPAAENPPIEANPVTARQDFEAAEAEDDLPAYLQYYEIEVVEEASAEQGERPMSQRSDKVRTMQYSERKINTARGPVVAHLASLDEMKSTIEETEKGANWPQTRHEKTTHISFIEENFPGGQLRKTEQTLSDAFKRSVNESRKPLKYAYAVLWMTALLSSWFESATITWFTSHEELTMILVSTIVAGSVGGVWLLMWTFPVLCRFVPLYSAAIVHLVLAALISLAPIVLMRWRPEGVAWVLLLVGLQLLMRYNCTFVCSYGQLLVSDSVYIDHRAPLQERGDTIGTILKGAGYVLGALTFSIESGREWPLPGLSFTGPLALSLLTLGTVVACRDSFPRFRAVPYTR